MTSPSTAAETAASPAEVVGAVEALEAAFTRIGHVVKRHLRDFATGIHPELRQAGWMVLGTALRAGSEGRAVTAGDIVTECGMDKSVVSRQLRSLSDWGLVELRRSDADARVVVVSATPLARERIREVRERQRELYASILAGWSREDMGRLEELLNRLADSIS